MATALLKYIFPFQNSLLPMKHTFTFLAFVLTFHAFAQTEKGNSFISGNLSTNFNVVDYPKDISMKSNSFSFSYGVVYGKFVKDNILWRSSISQSFSRSKYDIDQSNFLGKFRNPSTNVSISSGGFYYFGQERWRGFLGGGLRLSSSFSRTTQTDNNGRVSEKKDNSISINPFFEAGATYFFSKRLAVQLSATSTSFPLTIGGFSTGLLYWIKPTSYGIETKDLSTLQKGRWLLGTTFGFSNRTTDPAPLPTNARANESSANISFKISKFIQDKTLMGIRVGYSRDFNKNASQQDVKNTLNTYNAGVFVRKYFLPSRLTPYGEIAANYIRINSKQERTSNILSESHGNTYELYPSVGLAYLISNRFLIETELASFRVNYDTIANSDYKIWRTNLNAGLSPNFSVSYVF